MKKWNKNIILFILVAAFIVLGFGSALIQYTLKTVKDVALGIVHFSPTQIDTSLSLFESRSKSAVSYHDDLLTVNSIKDNVLGTRVSTKDGVAKAYSGKLVSEAKKVSTEKMNDTIDTIADLQRVAEENGAGFLYCLAPAKIYYETAPENVQNYERENITEFYSLLKQNNIPCISFADSFENCAIPTDQLFFDTDHHWKPRTGFEAYRIIYLELNKRYGFAYRDEYLDINNYHVETYRNWFLGSQGKKVGLYFTSLGADDFDLITPTFETHLTEEQPFKEEKRSGSFDETVLFLENLGKDYYHKGNYATYCGGDFRLQIIKNQDNPNGKKILLIRNSFACAVAPFLSLQTSELHICDVRKRLVIQD